MFFLTSFTQSLSKSVKNLWLVSMGQPKTARGKAILLFLGEHSAIVLDQKGSAWPQPTNAPARHRESLTCHGGQKELEGSFPAGLAAVEGMGLQTKEGRRGNGQGGWSSVFPGETCAVPCVYFCEFLWRKYCRAVITAVRFANNQQMWASISLWVVTFDGGIDFPRDAEILWQLSLTPSLHVLSGQHLWGFVVRVALVTVPVFSSGCERDAGLQQQFFGYFSSWKSAHLWAWHFLLSSF